MKDVRVSRKPPRKDAAPPHSTKAERAYGGEPTTVADYWILSLIIISATIVRLWASRGDLWLDEVWSLILAGSASSPLELFTRIRHDNNHVFNSLLLYLLGWQSNLIVYRLPAVLAGVLTVWAAYFAARPWGRLEGMVAAVLTGLSFPLIQYSSEARGYAFALMFALFAFIAMREYLAGSRYAGIWFSAAAVLGVLSHLSFFQAYAALATWSCFAFLRKERPWQQSAKQLAACHAPVLSFLAVLYWFQMRNMVIGGGKEEPVSHLIVMMLSVFTGASEYGWFSIARFMAVVLASVFSIAALARAGSDLWLFFASVLFLFPALAILISPTGYLYVRYFVVCNAFILLLMSYLLGWLYRRGKTGRILFLAAAGAFVAGNAIPAADLIRVGRGRYGEALEYIVETTGKERITLGSDHDFRTTLMLDFYAPRIKQGRRITYVDAESWPDAGPDWLIIHGLDPAFKPSPALADRKGNAYRLTGIYPFAGLSGWSWFLYRREISVP